MEYFRRRTVFESDFAPLTLDVDLEVKSGTDSDNERSEGDSLSELGSLVEENVEEVDISDEEDELEVEIDEVTVGQQLVAAPLDPSLLLYVKKDNVQRKKVGKGDGASILENHNSVTKVLRGIKRPPKVRAPPIENSHKVCTPASNDQHDEAGEGEREESSKKDENKERKGRSKSGSKHKYPPTERSKDCYLTKDEGTLSNKSVKVVERKEGKRIESLGTSKTLVGTNSCRSNVLDKSNEQKCFECADCGRKFPEKSHLATHLRAHVDIRNFRCPKCGLAFKTETNLRFHITTHAEAPFHCNDCNKTFPGRKMLKRHLRVVHSAVTFTCEQCGRSFKSAVNLSLHYSLHSGSKPFSCSLCGKGFVYKSTLSSHLRTHESQPSGSECSACNESRSCAHGRPASEKCDVCDARAPVPCTHQSPARPFLCTVCGKAYPLKGTLKNHMKTHDPEKPYKCGECPKSFTKKQSLECHTKKCHLGERPEFMCDQCSLSYFNAFALRRHYLKHTTSRGFTCDTCGKSFWTKDALRVHSRTHSPSKGFPCDECPKVFAHKHSLSAHARAHSSRPHPCPLCPKSFVHKYNLARHERQHAQQHHSL